MSGADERIDPDPWAFSPRSNFGAGGAARTRNNIYEDSRRGMVWQPDVYAEAAAVARTVAATQIVDFGCGSGHKLMRSCGSDLQAVGIDFKGSLAIARRCYPNGSWLEANLTLLSDLVRAVRTLPPAKTRVLVASDVIEHLPDPRPLLGTLRRLLLEDPSSRLILSTPDRHRTHGDGWSGLPPNVCHVREWTHAELHRVLLASGFTVERSGFTRSNLDDERLATSLLVVSCPPAGHATFLESIAPTMPLSGGRLSVENREDSVECLEQALFLAPALQGCDVRGHAGSEEHVLEAYRCGLLPPLFSLNGETLPELRAVVSAPAVAVSISNLSLEWLRDWIEAVNHQSLAPRVVFFLDGGSSLEYRLRMHDLARRTLRVPFKVLRCASSSRAQAVVSRQARASGCDSLAYMRPSVLPLTDYLETAARYIANSGKDAVCCWAARVEAGEDWRLSRAARMTVRAGAGIEPTDLPVAFRVDGPTVSRGVVPKAYCLLRPAPIPCEQPLGFRRVIAAAVRRVMRGLQARLAALAR